MKSWKMGMGVVGLMASILAASSLTLWKLPLLIACWERSPKKRSTKFIQLLEVGVKWSSMRLTPYCLRCWRLRLSIQSLTSCFLWVA